MREFESGGTQSTPLITSADNPRLKLVKSLHERKDRAANKKFFVEGLRLCREALVVPSSSFSIDYLLFTPSFEKALEGAVFLRQARNQGIKSYSVADNLLKLVSGLDTPPGILGVLSYKEYSLKDVWKDQSSLCLLFADKVQEPGNLGALLRTVEGLGGNGVVTTKGGVDAFHPRVVRGSMGAVLRCPVFEAETLADWVLEVRKRKMQVVMAHPKGKVSLKEAKFTHYCTVVVGTEGQGLSMDALDLADEVVNIPTTAKAGSLNVAVAAGIILYEVLKQQGKLSQ